MGPTALLPLRRKACWGFFRPEKSDGFGRVWTRELGQKGQHATSRPPKPLISRSTCNKTWKGFRGFLKIFVYTQFSYIRCTNHELFQPVPPTILPFPSLFLYPSGPFATQSATRKLLCVDGNNLLWGDLSTGRRCNTGFVLFTDATWTILVLKSKPPHEKRCV